MLTEGALNAHRTMFWEDLAGLPDQLSSFLPEQEQAYKYYLKAILRLAFPVDYKLPKGRESTRCVHCCIPSNQLSTEQKVLSLLNNKCIMSVCPLLSISFFHSFFSFNSKNKFKVCYFVLLLHPSLSPFLQSPLPSCHLFFSLPCLMPLG